MKYLKISIFFDERRKQIGIFKYGVFENFKEFDLVEFLRKKIFSKLSKCKRKILTYVIDNAIEFEEENKRKRRFLHFVIKYCSNKIIKFLLSKNINLEYADLRGNTPVSYAIVYNKLVFLKHLTRNNIIYKIPDSLNSIIKYGNNCEIIKYFINGYDKLPYSGQLFQNLFSNSLLSPEEKLSITSLLIKKMT